MGYNLTVLLGVSTFYVWVFEKKTSTCSLSFYKNAVLRPTFGTISPILAGGEIIPESVDISQRMANILSPSGAQTQIPVAKPAALVQPMVQTTAMTCPTVVQQVQAIPVAQQVQAIPVVQPSAPDKE